MNDALRAAAVAIVSNGTIAALASTGKSGPTACAVFYVVLDGGGLAFKSRRASEHMKNFMEDPRAALTVYTHGSHYSEKVGVQFKGIVREPADVTEMASVVRRYSETFAGAGKKLAPAEELLRPDAASTFFVFEVHRFRLVDEGPRGSRTMEAMISWGSD